MKQRVLQVAAVAAGLAAILAPPMHRAAAASPVISSYGLTSGETVDGGPPGTQLVIKGSGFASPGTVQFNGTTLSFNAWADTYIRVVVPTKSSYAVASQFSVTTGGDTATGPAFTITAPGTAASIVTETPAPTPTPTPSPTPTPTPAPTPAPAPSPGPTPAPAGALNVRTFGATGDGSTDDLTAIQAALDAVPAGGSVYFPAGTYHLSDAARVDKSNVTLFGDGAASVLLNQSNNALQLGTGGQAWSGIVVRQLKFVGVPGQYKADGANGGGIQIYGPHGTVIDNCDFQGCAFAVYDAGEVGTTYGTVISNCRVQGWGIVAVFCNGGEQVTNCQLIQDDPDLYGAQSSHGFYIHSGCTNVLIADTLIQNARKYAAQVYGRDTGTFTRNITFQNVTVQGCANGITIQQETPGAARAQGVTITGCSFLNTYDGPALSIKQGDGIQILNNVIDGGSVGLQIGVWAPYEPGFSITNLLADGNTIRNCQRGIWALASNGGSFSGVTLSSNQITNCQQAVDLSGAPGVTLSP